MKTGINECDSLQKGMCECHNEVETCKQLPSHFLQDSSLFSCILNSMSVCVYTLSALGDTPKCTFLHLPLALLVQG